MQIVAIIVVMISVSALTLTRDWRVLLGSLAAQYVGIAGLFWGTMSSEIVLAELVLCVVTAALLLPPFKRKSSRVPVHAVREKERVHAVGSLQSGPALPEHTQKDELLSPVFQALTLGLCALAAISLAGTYPISGPVDGNEATSASLTVLNLAFFWLWVVGLLSLGTTRRPSGIAGGLLFILEAVQIGYLTRGTSVQPGAAFGLVAIQLLLVLIALSFRGMPSHGPSSGEEQAVATVSSGSRNPGAESGEPGIVIWLAGAALVVVLLRAGDVFLSSLVLTAVALLVALFFQPRDEEAASGLGRMKFIALAVVGGACLQVAAILASEFEIGRDPLLGRIVVGFLAVGLTTLVGAFPFHWWLLAVPRRANSLAATLALGLLSAGGFAFFLQMMDAYPSLLSDERSGTALMALGISGFVIASLIAVSRRDFASLVAYTAAGNAGVALAGMGAGSYQGSVGAAILLGNQMLALFLLALCSKVAREGRRWPSALSVGTVGAFARRAPFATLGIAFGSLTLLGVPPFTGFLGRWLVYTEVARQNTLLAGLIAVGSVLSLVSFIPIVQGFLQAIARDGSGERAGNEDLGLEQEARREPALQRIALLSLAIVPLGAGLYPPPILEAVAQIMKALQF